MKITELIYKLNDMCKEYGDIDVVQWHDMTEAPILEIEYIEYITNDFGNKEAVLTIDG